MEKNRNGIIDLTKFLLSIWVMCGHYSYIIAQEYKNVHITLLPLVFCGKTLTIPVAAFFVFSGYFASKYYRNQTTLEYIKKKIKRLFPVLSISISYFILSDIIFFCENGHFWAERNVTLSESILTYLGINTLVGSGSSINGPMWYVSVLLFCYYLFSVEKNCKLENKVLFSITIILGEMLCNWGNGIGFVSSNVTSGVASFFIGAILFEISFSWAQNEKIRLAFFLFVIIISVLILSYHYSYNFIGDFSIVTKFMVAPMIIFFSENKIFGPIINNKIVTYLSNISFPIFLLHIPTYVTICLLFSDGIVYNSYLTVCIIIMVVICESMLINKAFK